MMRYRIVAVVTIVTAVLAAVAGPIIQFIADNLHLL